MIFLTFNATIFYEFAGAFLEFHIINGCFAAVSTRLVGRLLCFVHDKIIFIIEIIFIIDRAARITTFLRPVRTNYLIDSAALVEE
jgi:hypothetical protein